MFSGLSGASGYGGPEEEEPKAPLSLGQRIGAGPGGPAVPAGGSPNPNPAPGSLPAPGALPSNMIDPNQTIAQPTQQPNRAEQILRAIGTGMRAYGGRPTMQSPTPLAPNASKGAKVANAIGNAMRTYGQARQRMGGGPKMWGMGR